MATHSNVLAWETLQAEEPGEATYSPCGQQEADTAEHTCGCPSPWTTVSVFSVCVSLFLFVDKFTCIIL